MAKVASAKGSGEKKETVVSNFVTYLREVWNELGKVTWPSREDLKAHTTIVMIFLAIFAIMIGFMDVVFQRTVLALFAWL